MGLIMSKRDKIPRGRCVCPKRCDNIYGPHGREIGMRVLTSLTVDVFLLS